MRPWAPVIVATFALLAACESKITDDVATHYVDFGEVSLDAGSVDLSHSFTIHNALDRESTIVAVKPSCGCVEAVIDTTSLAPRSSTVLSLRLNLTNVGRTTQGATVVFSDGRTVEYVLTATGTTRQLLSAFLDYPGSQGSRKVNLRAHFMAFGGVELQQPLRPVSPSGVTLEPHAWTTLEPSCDSNERPIRQVASISADFSEYYGPFPVKLVLTSESGRQCEVVVHDDYWQGGEQSSIATTPPGSS